jgi:hypothetical protein
VKKTNPSSSTCFNNTIRADGRPSGVAVASVIASATAASRHCVVEPQLKLLDWIALDQFSSSVSRV